ncbi:MAG TPA: RNA-binding protein [Bacteroidaceae bacterium]|nr:RNA-binding protein [Bacteroidaceae bacterium]
MNIFIGNLNYKIREEQLGNLLSEFGDVRSVKIVMDRETGRSKGFGFVEMSNDAEASAAIKELNGSEFEGRTMVVNEARPRN